MIEREPGRRIKHLLIGIGSGYHTSIRILHAQVKDISDGSILLFEIIRNDDHIGDDLLIKYSVDYQQFKKTFDCFSDWISEQRFDLIGISFMSHSWDIYLELTKIIRRQLPDCKIVAGGVHAWHVDPLKTLEYCDYVCATEGEQVYTELIESLSKPTVPSPLNIPGLYERFRGEVLFVPPCPYLPINQLPVPTVNNNSVWHLQSINDNPVLKNTDPMVNYDTLFIHIGRGCPFRCSYCVNSLKTDHIVRIRDVDVVINEIQALQKRCPHIKSIQFMDEIFPTNIHWIKEFTQKYKDQVDLPFQITLYPGLLNEEKILLLKEAGLAEVSIGVQSGSERIRKDIYCRPGTNAKILSENTILSKYNIMAYYDLIIRNPYETEQNWKETLELVRALKYPYYLKFYTLAFYPNHPITTRALQDKKIDITSIDPTIGYLDITTPHKKVIADHRLYEKSLLIWNERLLKNAIAGSVEDKYLLFTSYYGYSFIPRFVIDLLYNRFWNNDKILFAFSKLLNGLLVVRNTKIPLLIYKIMDYKRRYGFMNLIRRSTGMGLKRTASLPEPSVNKYIYSFSE